MSTVFVFFGRHEIQPVLPQPPPEDACFLMFVFWEFWIALHIKCEKYPSRHLSCLFKCPKTFFIANSSNDNITETHN